MSAAELLSMYERVADSPHAVETLRRFVLDLAARGKLVEQDPNDEPATELLRRIERSRAQLVSDAVNRNRSPLPEVEPGDAPFELPCSWRWVRLGNLVEFAAGRTPSRNDLTFWNTGDYAWASIADMRDGETLMATRETVSERARNSVFGCEPVPPGTILMSFKLTIGKIVRLGIASYHNEAIISIRPHSSDLDGYLFVVLPDRARAGETKGAIKGATLNRESIANILVPLAPLAEQHRIVAKVDELMALCDQFDAARTEREAARDRLAAASLARLNAPDPDTFEADARFALKVLPALSARPDQVKQLRQTILNLAVRGKLVPQDPSDEAAEQLVRRVRALAETAGRPPRTRARDLPRVDARDGPYGLPVGWAWARFRDLGQFGRGRSKHRPRNDTALFVGGSHPVIQTGDVARSDGLITTHTSKYNDVGLQQSMLWPSGTLCITIAANIADSGILSFDACFPDSVVGFVPAKEFDSARYFEYFVRTAKANLLEYAPATAQKNINMEILDSVMIPLPPLAEQHRIVVRVDQLMSLCDQLEAGLSDGDTVRGRFLDALLHEALEPVANVAA
jgi:type I restriction enzyme S subunit